MISLKYKTVAFLVAASALFAVASLAYAATPSVVSVKLTGANTLTVVYSEPVQTNSWDYTNFTGNLSGLGVVSIAGLGSSVITLSLNGTPVVSQGTSGYITIGTGVTSISTGSPFPGGSYNVTSAQAPVLSSVEVSVNNIGNTFSGVGSQITLTFTTNESVVNPTVTLLGHTIGVNGSGVGPYTVNYTLVSGDAQGTINATIMFTDTNGNSGNATVNVIGGSSGGTTGSVNGYITSTANAPGILYPGNTITFTLVPSTPEPNARGVVGSYNGVPLSWYSTNNGATYTAVYTVAAGQSNTAYPLQISGVMLTDQYGNSVGPFAGSDVQKTVTATAQTGPITLYQSAPISSPTTNVTPSYSFVSTEAGTIRYGGDCSSPTTSASAGLNTIVFNSLANGLHSNCTIVVTDVAGNVSNQLIVSPFTIGSPTAVSTISSSSTGTTVSQLQVLENELSQLQAQTSGAPTTTTKPSYQFTTFLSVGSTGAAVTALQQVLTADGFYAGPITGTYGSLTEAAVKKFQTSKGISPKGYIGPGTRAALNAG